MNYPFWDIDIGYGWMMGAIAVIHVFISHFAIGGGLYLVLVERSARRANDTFRIEFLQRLSKFFILVSVVSGALTGVGIWFIIGLINPQATEVLIHHFVWAWATEWTFFIVEIAAALIYFYGWKTMSARNHLIVGWIYFGAAWLSLFVINGIVCFMLTPGAWLQTGNFWDGIFNPSFWPSLAFRTGVCVMLAGLYALMVGAQSRPDKASISLTHYNALWAIVGLVIMAPTYFWYFKSIPQAIRDKAAEAMPTVMARTNEIYALWLVLLVLVVLLGLILPRLYTRAVGIVMMCLGLVWFGQFEWMREAIRKPYVIVDFMFGNGIEVAAAEELKTDGLLPHITFRTGDDGTDLFNHACRSCHTMRGYKPLAPQFDGADEAFIAGMVRGVGAMKGNMPPFLGTQAESKLIAAHIYRKTDHRSLAQIYGLSGVELGRKVYEVRCGSCHQIGGFNDKSSSLTGLSETEYNDLLDGAGDIADEMPAFTAPDEERKAMIEYLKTLPKGGGQ